MPDVQSDYCATSVPHWHKSKVADISDIYSHPPDAWAANSRRLAVGERLNQVEILRNAIYSQYDSTDFSRYFASQHLKPVMYASKASQQENIINKVVRLFITRSTKSISGSLSISNSYVKEPQLLHAVVLPNAKNTPTQDSTCVLDTQEFVSWESDRLAYEILGCNIDTDIVQLRQMLLEAEDRDFSDDFNLRLAPWLLDFVKKLRDSQNPEDRVAVLSALRTGASLLSPEKIDDLLPFLEPGFAIETSRVAIKMVGRIFEAYPPQVRDAHPRMAIELHKILGTLLNPHVLEIPAVAAKAQLAIYALAAMASSHVLRAIDDVNSLKLSWFSQRTKRKLEELRRFWSARGAAVSPAANQLLNDTLKKLISC